MIMSHIVQLIYRLLRFTTNISIFHCYYLSQELTEEGLPFLILFHKPEDTDTVNKYNQVISRELIGEKGEVLILKY